MVFGEDDTALYRDLLASQCRKHGPAVFCLLPDAQPRSSHSGPRPRGGARAHARREAPALFVDNQRAAQGDRPSLPGAVQLGREGRGAPDDGGTLCGLEPRAGAASCSWTRSALREFVTITVTVGAPADVFGLGFAGAPAPCSAFCASAGAATRPHSAAASATAKIRLSRNSSCRTSGTNKSSHSEIFARAASSPTMPRRKASTQATKTTPWMTVTHSPNWAR